MNQLCNKSFFYVKHVFIAIFFLFNKELIYADDNTTMNSPIILTDRTGNATALWISTNKTGMDIQSAVLPFGKSTWSDPIVISETRLQIHALKAAIDNLDNILVTWVNLDPISPILCVSANSFAASRSQWNEPANISGATQNTNDDVSISITEGNMNVIWSAYNEKGDKLLYSVSSVIEGNWNSPMVISAPPVPIEPSKTNKP